MLIAKITLISVDMSFIIYRKIITFNLKKKKRKKKRVKVKRWHTFKILGGQERIYRKAVNRVYVLVTSE